MATFLYRIGRFSYQRRWLVVGIWAVILVALGASAATMSGKMSNEFSIPGTEAQQAIDDLSERFPQANAGGATARIVFAAPEGKTVADPAVQAAIAQVVQARVEGARRSPGSSTRSPPSPSHPTASTRSRRSATRCRGRS